MTDQARAQPELPDDLPSAGLAPRAARVARAIREEVSRIILEELSDPRLGFITVTRVEPTPDLLQARVLVSVLGEAGARSASLRALESACRLVERLVNRRLQMRHLVRLRFVEDETPRRTAELEALIRRARATDRDAGRSPESGDRSPAAPDSSLRTPD